MLRQEYGNYSWLRCIWWPWSICRPLWQKIGKFKLQMAEENVRCYQECRHTPLVILCCSSIYYVYCCGKDPFSVVFIVGLCMRVFCGWSCGFGCPCCCCCCCCCFCCFCCLLGIHTCRRLNSSCLLSQTNYTLPDEWERVAMVSIFCILPHPTALLSSSSSFTSFQRLTIGVSHLQICLYQDDGSHYYYNSKTLETQWDPPSVGGDRTIDGGGTELDPNALHAAVSDAYTSAERVRTLVAEGYSPNASNEAGDS